MIKIHLTLPGLSYSACGNLLKTKKEYKNSKKQEVQDILITKNPR